MSEHGERLFEFLQDQEGFKGVVFSDVGRKAIGFGHRLLPGEKRTSISRGEANQLLRDDIAKHRLSAQQFIDKQFGEESFGQLSPLKQDMLTEFEFNGALRKFPKFTQAVLSGDLNGQITQFQRNSKGKSMERRNLGFARTFLQPQIDAAQQQPSFFSSQLSGQQ